MNDDEAVLLIFLLGFATGIGTCLCVLIYSVAQKRRASVLQSPPDNQPIARLDPLVALRATRKQRWQNPNPLFNSSWKN